MKVLVTGANGLLGQHLVKMLALQNFEVVATGRGPCRLSLPGTFKYTYKDIDLTNNDAVSSLLHNEAADVIVHSGAMTQVDECEQNQDACFEINVQATAQLLVAAETYAAFFIFLSTDFVFDGEKGFYREEDHLNPLSWYGFTKVQAESTVETSEIPWAIVRTCLVYGNLYNSKRSNIISWVKENLSAGKEIRVVSDQYRTPTWVEDLARGIVLIIKQQATGIFHISGNELLTPYHMAMATAEHYHLNKMLIKEVDGSVFSQPAKRPPKTGFDITKARTMLGFLPTPFSEGLKLMDNE